MRHPPTADIEELLRALGDAQVDSIVDERLHFRVIDLDTLIAIKRSTGRARDILVLPLLLALRARRTP